MDEELVGWGRADIAEIVPTYPPRQTGKEVLNKTSTCNMENKVHILIARHGICLSLLACEHTLLQILDRNAMWGNPWLVCGKPG